ncbi:TIGR01440 family protein [Metasolibacillus sp. FSL H7-0170]|uniref:TIGR01440 family protein n=1 Tax=Metasolibacillus TaxID=2703677 RepID=UPI00079535EA|nr:TIGR01440 family protein [Metasolibacillus fluoroglycofenilyticus]KYG90233.1 TIGR01440 family protein [[Bacillus] sp. KCTC 13219]
MTNLTDMHKSLATLLSELEQQVVFQPQQLFVVGCSTSEVMGERIGTAGAMDVATAIYEELQAFAERHQLYLAFQGCEHINRALTLEYAAAEKYQLEPVHVVPVKTAGGSMSAHAYKQMQKPVVVENIQAHAGIDIGQTLIGMHLKAVAVPIRTSVKTLGEAVVTVATTRPKLIGGVRAQYE